MMIDDAGGEPWAPRPRYLAWLPAFLFQRDGGKPAYIVKAWLLAIVPSLLLAALLQALRPATTGPDIASNTPLLFTLLVFVGPLLESMIMGLALILLERWLGAGRAVVVSAILWGVAHSLAEPTWGLVVWWPFLVLSIVFLTWRSRGAWLAVWMATAVHGLQNSVPAVLLLFAPTV